MITRIKKIYMKRRLLKEEEQIINHITPSLRRNLNEMWEIYNKL